MAQRVKRKAVVCLDREAHRAWIDTYRWAYFTGFDKENLIRNLAICCHAQTGHGHVVKLLLAKSNIEVGRLDATGLTYR